MGKSLREAYGEALVELGKINDKVVVLDADLSGATKTSTFKKEFPDRFYNVGIAEQNLLGIASGFAHNGLIPFASTFAVFGTGRAFEIIRNQIAHSNLNVKMGFSHTGLSVGEDGATHQSFEDVALMRQLPNVTVLAPCDATEMKKAVFAAAMIKGPVFIRSGRPNATDITSDQTPFEVGKANVMKDGEDVCIIAYGAMVEVALNAANILNENGISAAVINMHTIKPIDKDIIIKYANKCKKIITCEDHSIIGGLGSATSEVMAENECTAKLVRIGIDDKFGHSGAPKDLYKEYGLTVENIVAKCK